MSSGPQA
ncbi:unnamed protein product, partial [Didymodactylos carnosus]